MILVIDVGNTNMALGVYEKEELLAQKKQSQDKARDLLDRGQALLGKVHEIKVQEITYQKI